MAVSSVGTHVSSVRCPQKPGLYEEGGNRIVLMESPG